jgi:hypothetical protein
VNYPPRDQRVIDSQFDIWLARDLLFNNPPGVNFRRYPKYSKAKKVKYTRVILRYLDKMEKTGEVLDMGDRGRAVAIELGGMLRYVWRVDLLTEAEYDEAKKRQAPKLASLRKKLRRNVGTEPTVG